MEGAQKLWMWGEANTEHSSPQFVPQIKGE